MQAVGEKGAYRNRTVAHEAAQAVESRCFHFKMGDALTAPPKIGSKARRFG